MPELKTSEEWQKEFADQYRVLDPDGWDRRNYEYSWGKELITREEFEARAAMSTLELYRAPNALARIKSALAEGRFHPAVFERLTVEGGEEIHE